MMATSGAVTYAIPMDTSSRSGNTSRGDQAVCESQGLSLRQPPYGVLLRARRRTQVVARGSLRHTIGESGRAMFMVKTMGRFGIVLVSVMAAGGIRRPRGRKPPISSQSETPAQAARKVPRAEESRHKSRARLG